MPYQSGNEIFHYKLSKNCVKFVAILISLILAKRLIHDIFLGGVAILELDSDPDHNKGLDPRTLRMS